jgi:acyl CoA:acetate/3-ketoacid CoA transferase beta subunit
MEAQVIIARRIAKELSDGMLVNLGIGIQSTCLKECTCSSSPKTG